MIRRLSHRAAIAALLSPASALGAYLSGESFVVIIFSAIVPLIVVQALLASRIYAFLSSSLALFSVVFCTFPFFQSRMVVDVPSWVPSLLYWPFSAALAYLLIHQLNIAFLLIKSVRRLETETQASSPIR